MIQRRNIELNRKTMERSSQFNGIKEERNQYFFCKKRNLIYFQYYRYFFKESEYYFRRKKYTDKAILKILMLLKMAKKLYRKV